MSAKIDLFYSFGPQDDPQTSTASTKVKGLTIGSTFSGSGRFPSVSVNALRIKGQDLTADTEVRLAAPGFRFGVIDSEVRSGGQELLVWFLVWPAPRAPVRPVSTANLTVTVDTSAPTPDASSASGNIDVS